MEEEIEVTYTDNTGENDYTELITKIDELIQVLSNDRTETLGTEENSNIQLYQSDQTVDYTFQLDQILHYHILDFYLLIVITIFTLFRK